MVRLHRHRPLRGAAGAQPFFTERFLYLDCYTPSDTRRSVDRETPARAAHGLPDDAIVFCCFNNAYKILPPVFDVWMRILAACRERAMAFAVVGRDVREPPPGGFRARHRGAAADLCAARGPGRCISRVSGSPTSSSTRGLQRRHDCERRALRRAAALTCAGETLASRVAASQLRAMGVPELVTDDLAAYERRAIELARDPGELARCARARGEPRVLAALRHGALHRAFEDALMAAWSDYERTSATATS
jgi:hypothetical protein